MARKKPIVTEANQQTADMTTEINRLIATRAESTPPAQATDDFDFETTTSGGGEALTTWPGKCHQLMEMIFSALNR